MHKKNYFLMLACLVMSTHIKPNIVFDFLGKWSEFNKTMRTGGAVQKASDDSAHVTKDAIGLHDLVGSHPAVLDDIVDFFMHRVEREAQGIEMPRGILLCGPAGTGKTSFAKALAHDLGWSCIETSASDFEEVYVGLGASRIRGIFTQARKQQPCVIIIDEVDAIGNRDSLHGNDLSRQLIDALLAEMDGIHSGGDILVIGTTNEVSLVDKALRRPGRFDYVIEIGLPDEESRTKIITYYLEKRKYDSALDIQPIVRATRGFSGAELKELVKRATIASVRNKHTLIMQDDLQDGLEQMLKERKNRR